MSEKAIEIDVPQEHINIEEKTAEQQLQEFLDQFTPEEIEKIRANQKAFKDMLIEAEARTLKAIESEDYINLEEGQDLNTIAFVIPSDDPTLNTWMNQANMISTLNQYGKLDDEFVKEVKQLSDELQRIQLLHLTLIQQAAEEVDQQWSQLDNQMFILTGSYFSNQIRSALNTLVFEVKHGILSDESREQITHLINDCAEKHMEYLSFIDIDTRFIYHLKQSFEKNLEAILTVKARIPEEEMKRRYEKHAATQLDQAANDNH